MKVKIPKDPGNCDQNVNQVSLLKITSPWWWKFFNSTQINRTIGLIALIVFQNCCQKAWINFLNNRFSFELESRVSIKRKRPALSNQHLPIWVTPIFMELFYPETHVAFNRVGLKYFNSRKCSYSVKNLLESIHFMINTKLFKIIFRSKDLTCEYDLKPNLF